MTKQTAACYNRFVINEYVPEKNLNKSRLQQHLGWAGYAVVAGVSAMLWLLALLRPEGLVYHAHFDFMGYFIGAYMFVHGQQPPLYDLATQLAVQHTVSAETNPPVAQLFIYPAWNALILAPLALLPYPIAFLIAEAVNGVAAFFSLHWLIRLAATSPQERRCLWLATAGFLPLAMALWQGQMTGLVLCSVTGTLLALRRSADRQAGAWLVLGLLKPQLLVGLGVALVATRRRQTVFVWAGGGALLTAVSTAVFGNWIPAFVAYLRQFTDSSAGLGDHAALMQNWRGGVYMLLRTESPLLVWILTLGGVGLLLVFLWLRGQTTPIEVSFAMAGLIGLLSNPHLYLYDTAIALAPALVLWHAACLVPGRGRVLRALLCTGPFVPLVAAIRALPFTEIGAWYMTALVLLAFWTWLPQPLIAKVETA